MRLIRNPKFKKSCLSDRDPNSLPNELLLSIFKDFPTGDLLTRIGPVCSRWYSLARSIVQRRTRALLLRSSTTPISPPSEELHFFSVDPSTVEVLSVNFSAPDLGDSLGSTFSNVDTLIVYSTEKGGSIPAAQIATLLTAWSSTLTTVKLLVSRDSLFQWRTLWSAIDGLSRLAHLSINAHYLAVERHSPVFEHLQEFNYGQAFVRQGSSSLLDVFRMLSLLSSGPLPPSLGLFSNGLLSLRCDLAKLKAVHPAVSRRIVRLSDRIAAHCFRASHTNLVQLSSSSSPSHLTTLSLYLDHEKDYQSYYHLLFRYAPSLRSVSFTVQSLFTGNIFNFAVTQRAINAALPKEVTPSVQSVTFFCYIEKRKSWDHSQMANVLLERGRLLFPNATSVVIHDQTKESPIPVMQSSIVP
ncbi:hypothetical protein TYRP_014123 [Tyrophagus putrescentiae]|nr:hypothetical protein TYRP_014123 [Tyrophagus putrescentiae]